MKNKAKDFYEMMTQDGHTLKRGWSKVNIISDRGDILIGDICVCANPIPAKSNNPVIDGKIAIYWDRHIKKEKFFCRCFWINPDHIEFEN